MVVKLSSKGQLVIPKEIRQALDLKAGTTFEVELVNGKIVLKPVMSQAIVRETIEEMRSVAGGAPLLDDLEAEHQRELMRDKQRE